MMKKPIPNKLKPLTRAFRIDSADATTPVVDIAARTMRLSFSSEEPVDMGWCTEILSHNKSAVKIAGRQATMPLLFNHNMDDLLGVVESIEIGADNRGYAGVRFGKDERGDWAMQQAADGVLINASFMYRVYEYEFDDDTEVITATNWEPFEISLVTIPADASVGVGRAAGDSENDIKITQRMPAIIEKPEPASAGFILPDASRTTTAAAETLEGKTMNKRHILQDKADDGTSGTAGGTLLSKEELIKIQADVRAAAINDERARATEVEAMCRTHKLDDNFRNTLISGNFDIAECRGRVLIELAKRGTQSPLGSVSDDIGLTDKEQRGYSLMRAVNSIVTGSWKEAGFEREVSEQIAKRNGSQLKETSFYMPNDLPFAPTKEHLRALRAVNSKNRSQRAIYQVGTAGQGGNLVETDLLAESFIEVLRNQTVTSKLGATYLPGLVGNVDIPRQISATGTYWVGESGALTEAEATFDKVSLRPKTIGALSKISRLMLLQSTPAIEMLARRDLMAVGALAIDLAAMSGSGSSNQPTGIINQSGVGSVVGGTNGANLSFDHIIQLQYTTKFANAPQASTGYALNSKAVGYLATQKSSTGQYLWDPLGGLTNSTPDKLKGRDYAESQQLRNTLTKGSASGICSELIYGNWQELLIGEWGVTEIALNPYDSTGFADGDVILRMFQTLDIAVRHAASFAVMSDALTPGF